MESPLPPPQPSPEATARQASSGAVKVPGKNARKPRQRHVFSSWVQSIEGEEWTFTLRTDGVHATAKGRGNQSASYPDVLAVLVKQKTFNLV